MVTLVDSIISDDPFLRRLQLVEVVIQHCSDILWRNKPEKKAKVPMWLDKVRGVIKKHSVGKNGAASRSASVPPAKDQSNGLTVASSDVVVRKTKDGEVEEEEVSETVSTVPVEGCCCDQLPPTVTSSFHLESLPLETKRISGGITNELFHVFDADDVEHSLVVRVYGKETDRVISRESELFYQSGVLDTYVHGQNFLVYKFLYGYLPLPYDEMEKECESIMRKVAEFHVGSTLAAKSDVSEPLIADSAVCQAGIENRFYADGTVRKMEGTRYDRERNLLLHALLKWPHIVASPEILAMVNPEKTARFLEQCRELTAACEETAAALKEREKSGHYIEGVCHNDLLAANILRNNETRDFVIIDFDYTRRNYLLFDLSNHINEYCGLECDYAKYFPDDAGIARMVRLYRGAMRERLEALRRERGAAVTVFAGEEAFWTADEAEEERLVREWTIAVKQISLGSHLLWSVWSLLQEAVSSIDVDFLDYSKMRFQRYKETKHFMLEK